MSDPSPYPGTTAYPDSTGAIDPYAPPKASITPGASEDLADAELTRRELLNHETSIRGIGSLYLLSALFMGLFAVVTIGGAILGGLSSEPEYTGLMGGLGAVYGLLAWLFFYLGRGLRRLAPKVRIGVTLLAGLGLLQAGFGLFQGGVGLLVFLIGALFNGYILYLLHSGKGKRVMTAEYQAIVAQTPHIKYRTPMWLIVLGILLVALFVVSLFLAFAT